MFRSVVSTGIGSLYIRASGRPDLCLSVERRVRGMLLWQLQVHIHMYWCSFWKIRAGEYERLEERWVECCHDN